MVIRKRLLDGNGWVTTLAVIDEFRAFHEALSAVIVTALVRSFTCLRDEKR